MKRFLLDTNVLLGLARRAPWARNVMDELDLEDHGVAAYTSVICHGEILALAEKNGWGPHKRIELDGILHQLPRLDINREAILNAYALIDAWTHGKPGRFSPAETCCVDGKERSVDRGHGPRKSRHLGIYRWGFPSPETHLVRVHPRGSHTRSESMTQCGILECHVTRRLSGRGECGAAVHER